MTRGQLQNVLRNAVARGGGPKVAVAAAAALTRILGYREQRRLCEDGGFVPPDSQSSWLP